MALSLRTADRLLRDDADADREAALATA